jgi:hypothetical protein
MVEWQTIDSAPKDGTEFLGYDRKVGKMDVCEWSYDRFRAVQFDGECGPLDDEFCTPSHWAPLPDAPVVGT